MPEDREHVLQAPERKGPRRRPFVVAGLLLVLLGAAVWFDRSDSTPELALGAECPAELGDCSGVPDTTVPDVTTTTVDPSAVVTTTSIPPGELLTAESGTLRLEVRLEPVSLVTAQLLRVHVKATDRPRSVIVGGHDYGDGFGGARPAIPILECKPTLPTTTAPEPDTVRTWTFEYSYRQPGRYLLKVEVASTSCRDVDADDPHYADADGDGYIDEDGDTGGRRAVVKTALNVVQGQLLANGPLQPAVALDRVPSHDDPSTVLLNIGAKDLDGWMQKVVLDWGDGSAPFVEERGMEQCIDPLKRWPGPGEIVELASHKYPTSTSYTATLTATSVGCDGSGAQTVTTTIRVDAP
ncbi:MAG TPA: hypothetical protein VHF47_05865 [Acidimicrobiales bacterium]|nr:hypothetical protein [Acidimicrobiales bacterium]